jgi:hypothetical protein
MFQMVANLADEMSFIVDVIRGTLFDFSPFARNDIFVIACEILGEQNFRLSSGYLLLSLFISLTH